MYSRSSEATGRRSERGPSWTQPGDSLTDILRDLRLTQSFYCHSELQAPWGLGMPAEDHAIFHYVAEGRAWLRRDGHDPLPLERGDFVLVGARVAHAIACPADAPATPVHQLPFEKVNGHALFLRYGGASEHTVLACGGIRFEDPAAHPLVTALPEVLHVRAGADGQGQLLRQMLDAMGTEALHPRPGGTTVMLRLADILVIHAVRSWIDAGAEDRTGWLGALRDPQIGRALVLMHRQPERDWTVADLAAQVNMSRSVFSDRFTTIVGAPPLLYLTRWRMHLATRWLRDEKATLADVASRLGYESEPSFSRAFKRHVGVAPGSVRKSGRTPQGARPSV